MNDRTRFVKLTLGNGREIYVAVLAIGWVSVRPNSNGVTPAKPDMTEVCISGTCVSVFGTPDEVLAKIEGAEGCKCAPMFWAPLKPGDGMPHYIAPYPQPPSKLALSDVVDILREYAKEYEDSAAVNMRAVAEWLEKVAGNA